MRNFDYSIKMLNSFQAEFLFNLFVFICAFSLILYLPRIRYYIAGLKKPRRAFNQEKKSLAVIVPAKNEKGLRVLLDSLAAQTYDKDFYDIYVVVGDKNDPNIELCKSYKNCFTKIIENQTCKGEALDGILQDLLQEGKRKYEGFVIVDADNIVDANFLMEMNNAFAFDKQIVLGKRCVKNYLYGKKYRSWAVNCNALTYTFLDKMGNCFRTERNMSNTICGTGLMVRRDLVQAMGGWPYRSMTEDFELTVTALLNNWTSCYYEYAVTYTEEGISLKSCNARRRRWLMGYAQVGVKYGKLVSQKFWKYVRDFFCGSKESVAQNSKQAELESGNFWGCFDYLFSFVPLYIYFAGTAILALAFMGDAAYKFFAFQTVDLYSLHCAVKILLVLYGVLFFYTAIAFYEDRAMYGAISVFEKVFALFVNPFYITQYAQFYIEAYYLLLTKKKAKQSWIQVERMES